MGLEDQVKKALAALPTKPRTYIVRKKRAGGKKRHGPRDGVTEVQSLLFPRKQWWTTKMAQSWARAHHFKSTDVDVTDEHIRLRQASPSQFKRMRTKILSKKPMVKAIIGVRS